MFLKRIYYPEVQLSDLFIGNSFTVFNRVFVVKAHCNSATSKYMTEREVHLLCIIRSNVLNLIGNVITLANSSKLMIGKIKTVSNDVYESGIILNQGDVIIEIVALDQKATNIFIETVTKQIGNIEINKVTVELLQNLLIGCKELPVTSNCTLCLIKPHVIKSLNTGKLISKIINEGINHISLSYSCSHIDLLTY